MQASITDHRSGIAVPMLFLQGTADPFARPARIRAVVDGLGDLATIETVEGGDHSFKVRGARAEPREVGASLAPPAAAFVRRVAGGA